MLLFVYLLVAAIIAAREINRPYLVTNVLLCAMYGLLWPLILVTDLVNARVWR